jgi:hypothetical protein
VLPSHAALLGRLGRPAGVDKDPAERSEDDSPKGIDSWRWRKACFVPDGVGDLDQAEAFEVVERR